MPLLGHHPIHFNRSLRPVADQQLGRQHRRQNLLLLFSPGELPFFPLVASDPFGLTDFPLDNLIACLQELAKSVERHTRSGGRHGYLQFIDGFLK